MRYYIPKRWNNLNLLRLGTRAYAQISDKFPSERDSDTNLVGFYRSGDSGYVVDKRGNGRRTTNLIGDSFEISNKYQSRLPCEIHLVGFYKPYEPGSGAGKGSGGGGTIRRAGGSFGKRGAALENEYFYKQQQAVLKKLRDKLRERRKQRDCQKQNERKDVEHEEPE